ncbi:MAG TPA: hypothetical protein VFW64_15675 [Pseudonocardiaceae bacterium]|nr:hypothetical protein [Pseudonocardiaceae bacterium]
METANAFSTKDAAAPSPNRSPLNYGINIIALVIPGNAVQLVLAPSTTLRVSEDPEMNSYCLIASGTIASFDVASVENVFIQQYASAGTVNFRFTTTV